MKVCVFGNIAAGKTSLIDDLKEKLNWETLAIDDFRRIHGNGTEESEQVARDAFFSSIKPNHHQLIECTGAGQVGDQLFKVLEKYNEPIICIVLITDIATSKERIKNRQWDIPFPHKLENLTNLIERIDAKIKSGEISSKWKTVNKSIVIENQNITLQQKHAIIVKVISLVKSNLPNLNEIEQMLSPHVQQYYGNEYLGYQSQVIKSNGKFQEDQKMIVDFIKQRNFKGNILDIGAGSCQWFSAFEQTISHYYAIDTNKTALELTPRHHKITTINQNIFDDNFSIVEVIKDPIHLILYSFFLSHFSDEQISQLINKIKDVKHIIIIDSFWGEKHQQKYTSKDLSNIERKTSKETTIELPKRFFDRNSLEILCKKLGFEISSIETGSYWLICLVTRVKNDL